MGEFLVLITSKYPQIENLLYEHFSIFITLLQMATAAALRQAARGRCLIRASVVRLSLMPALMITLDDYLGDRPCHATQRDICGKFGNGCRILPEERETAARPKSGERQERRGFFTASDPKGKDAERVRRPCFSHHSRCISISTTNVRKCSKAAAAISVGFRAADA